jgi:hypothetical protein
MDECNIDMLVHMALTRKTLCLIIFNKQLMCLDPEVGAEITRLGSIGHGPQGLDGVAG